MSDKKFVQYISRKVSDSSIYRIKEVAKSLGIADRHINDSLHTTLIYTYSRMDTNSINLNKDKLIITTQFYPKIFDIGEGKSCIVLELGYTDNMEDKVYSNFVRRNGYLVSLGGRNNYDEYRPHITLSYELPIGIRKHPLIDNPIILTVSYTAEEYEEFYEK